MVGPTEGVVMALLNEEVRSFLPKLDFTRREFVVTALAAGFAASVDFISSSFWILPP